MEHENDSSAAIETLRVLAQGAIGRLRKLPQPVVRVSGPLTSGGFGYERNLERFIIAQRRLREEGFTVFDYFEDNDDEAAIKELAVDWGMVMEHYHLPILETGLISAVYMMPGSETSNGATMERKYFVRQELPVRVIPESWFEAP
jgi:hypothetical protein